MRPAPMRSFSVLALLGALAAPGCAYEEGLLIQNLKGRVFVPKEAATREIAQADGSTVTLTDPRLIGPVYLGLYPSILPENVAAAYPHPEVGPQFKDGVPGDTYPYGGTTVGDLRFACFEALACKTTSGRFVDYQDILDWFNLINQPIVDAAGTPVDSAEFIRQTCYDILNVTADDEVRITAYEDRNEDGKIDAGDLDFVEDGDFYVAEFTLWQQEYFWDQNQEDCTPGTDCRGFSLWAFMDAPSSLSYQFSTCDPSLGFQNQEYNNEFFGGAPFANLLNFPATYITEGDWTSRGGDDAYVWEDVYDQPDIYLDFPVQ